MTATRSGVILPAPAAIGVKTALSGGAKRGVPATVSL